ncbi:MAG: tripartite tricarboxylate transporter substrate binding protein [Rubrivivax sp.]|nr:tripartite tricarboxylate transporter substrate binding protein [Rubrivivax sp.]
MQPSPRVSRRRCLRHLAAGPAAALLAVAGAWPLAAAAQGWPDRPLRIMVGASPGGGTDILARLLAEKMAPALKQTIVIENRPGASNTIAADIAAKAAPDGTTLLLATNTGQAVAPHLIKLKFDPLKDLQPVGLVAIVPNVLVVSASSPYKSVKELLAAMQANPGGIKYGSSGIGSTQHIVGEAFTLSTKTKAIHVPYKGSAQAHIDIIGGQVEMMFDTTSSAMAQIRGGKFRPLAVTTPQRSAELPDVPTLAEQGVSGADIQTWYAMYVTAGTPKPVVDRLAAELTAALKLPEVAARIKGLGGEIQLMTPEQFAEMNRSEFERYGRLVRDAGIKAEGQ